MTEQEQAVYDWLKRIDKTGNRYFAKWDEDGRITGELTWDELTPEQQEQVLQAGATCVRSNDRIPAVRG